MPNEHGVYMHDTPMKQLFGSRGRAFSAGCVRVQDVFTLAEWVARYEPVIRSICAELLTAMAARGGGDICEEFSARMPIRVFNAWMNLPDAQAAELAEVGRRYNIACGQIDIGNAATEMTVKMEGGVLQANGQTAPEPRLDVAHVVRAVLYMASLPLDANVQFMTVMATKMPFVGRG